MKTCKTKKSSVWRSLTAGLAALTFLMSANAALAADNALISNELVISDKTGDGSVAVDAVAAQNRSLDILPAVTTKPEPGLNTIRVSGPEGPVSYGDTIEIVLDNFHANVIGGYIRTEGLELESISDYSAGSREQCILFPAMGKTSCTYTYTVTADTSVNKVSFEIFNVLAGDKDGNTTEGTGDSWSVSVRKYALKYETLEGGRKVTGYIGELPAVLEVPYGVSEIGGYAFGACENLKEVILPVSLRKIDSSAFMDCVNLEMVHLPESIKSIGRQAFKNCSSLRDINLPNSLETIDGVAFQNCSSLTAVNLPNQLKTVEDLVFDGCSNLTDVHLPDSLETIDGWAFASCRSLKNINFPDSLQIIGTHAFGSSWDFQTDSYRPGCESLTEVVLPESVAKIDTEAFYNCTGLTRIVLPGSLESLNPSSFGADRALPQRTIFFGGSREDWNELNKDDRLFGVEDIVICAEEDAPGPEPAANEIRVAGPDGPLHGGEIIQITAGNRLARDIIHGRIRTEGLKFLSASDQHSSLYQVWLVPDQGASECTFTYEVSAGEGNTVSFEVYYVHAGSNSSWETAGIGHGWAAVVSEGAAAEPKPEDGPQPPAGSGYSLEYMAHKSWLTLEGFKGTLPEHLDLPAGDYQWLVCPGFAGQTSLKTVTIPEGIECINGEVFENCTNLEEITIPRSMNYIYRDALVGCTNLRTMHYAGTKEEFEEIDFVLPNGVELVCESPSLFPPAVPSAQPTATSSTTAKPTAQPSASASVSVRPTQTPGPSPSVSAGPTAVPAPAIPAAAGYQGGWMNGKTYYGKTSGSRTMFYLRRQNGTMNRVAAPYVTDKDGNRYYPLISGSAVLFPRLENGKLSAYCTFQNGMEIPVLAASADIPAADSLQSITVGVRTYFVRVSGSRMMFYLRRQDGSLNRVAAPYILGSDGVRYYPVNCGGTMLAPQLYGGRIASYSSGAGNTPVLTAL